MSWAGSLGAIFMLSLLGSWHCGLMCGGFSASLAQGSRLRLFAFHLGRLMSYVGTGACAGWIGERLFGLPGWARWAAGGVFLILLALLLWATLQDFSRRKHARNSAFKIGLWERTSVRFENLLRAAMMRVYRWPGAGFFMGLLNVFLPCGWLYGFLLAAASAGSAWSGALVMFAFWLGSLPILLASGLYFWKMQSLMPARLKPILQAVVICAAMWSVAGFFAH